MLKQKLTPVLSSWHSRTSASSLWQCDGSIPRSQRQQCQRWSLTPVGSIVKLLVIPIGKGFEGQTQQHHAECWCVGQYEFCSDPLNSSYDFLIEQSLFKGEDMHRSVNIFIYEQRSDLLKLAPGKVSNLDPSSTSTSTSSSTSTSTSHQPFLSGESYCLSPIVPFVTISTLDIQTKWWEIKWKLMKTAKEYETTNIFWWRWWWLCLIRFVELSYLEKRPCEGLVAGKKKTYVIRTLAAHHLFWYSQKWKSQCTMEVINVEEMNKKNLAPHDLFCISKVKATVQDGGNQCGIYELLVKSWSCVL